MRREVIHSGHCGTVFAAMLGLFLCGSAARAEPVGRATSAVPNVTVTHGGAVQNLDVDTPLEQNDRIRTDAKGAAEIEFVDETTLTVGANSEVVLDKMIFDGDKAKNATLQIVRGTLRFVTGNSDHQAYQIRTPVATVGVRGTVIDLSLEESGEMVFNTVEGVGVVCHSNAGCREVRVGDAPIAISRIGFSLASAAQASRLFSRLNGAHVNLSRRIGRDPKLGKGWLHGSRSDSQRGKLDKLRDRLKGNSPDKFKEGDKLKGGDKFNEGKSQGEKLDKVQKPSFGERFRERLKGFKLAPGKKERLYPEGKPKDQFR